jgi:TPP-dependent pyruvate/acetoin dehydrogenase alpha subunit
VLEQRAAKVVDDAVTFAETSDEPDAAALFEHVFNEEV